MKKLALLAPLLALILPLTAMADDKPQSTVETSDSVVNEAVTEPLEPHNPWDIGYAPFSYVEMAATGTKLDKPVSTAYGTKNRMAGLELSLSAQLGKYFFASFAYHNLNTEIGRSGGYKFNEKKPGVGVVIPTSNRALFYGRHELIKRSVGKDGYGNELGFRYLIDPGVAVKASFKRDAFDGFTDSGFKLALTTTNRKGSGWYAGYEFMDNAHYKLGFRVNF